MSLQQRATVGSQNSPTSSLTPALFLDRDGVIIENRADYVRRWQDVEIYPQALAALARLRDWQGKIIIVTNQSVVGRGLISRGRADAINARLLQLIARAGGRIDAVYMCPHAPTEGCNCRKPQPGLLLQAQRALALDMPNSIIIGDALTDLSAGRAAGLSQAALLKTGRGREQLALPAAAALAPFPVYATLEEAIQQLFFSESVRA